MNLAGLTAVAFLDIHGRYAKDAACTVTVRLWFNPDDSPLSYTDLTVAEFDALTVDERETIRNAGSAAGLVVTEGISNA